MALATFEAMLGVNQRDAMVWPDAVGGWALFTYGVHFEG
jgi:hypothetical protein